MKFLVLIYRRDIQTVGQTEYINLTAHFPLTKLLKIANVNNQNTELVLKNKSKSVKRIKKDASKEINIVGNTLTLHDYHFNKHFFGFIYLTKTINYFNLSFS